MEQRWEPRFPVEAEVYVTILGDSDSRFAGRIVNLSATGLGLVAGRPVAAGTAVQIDGDDMLLLGEVVYCSPAGGDFALGLRLEHALYGLTQLALAARQAMGTPQDRGCSERTPV